MTPEQLECRVASLHGQLVAAREFRDWSLVRTVIDKLDRLYHDVVVDESMPRIVADESVPRGEVHARDRHGRLVAKITNIA